MIPQRLLSAVCEISTGTLTVTNIPPLYTGEASALQVQVTLKNNGSNYTPEAGVVAEMYLYFPNTENMSYAVEMTRSGNVITGVLPASATGVDGYPLLIIQLTDTNTNSVIVAAHYQVRMIKARGKYIVSTEAPSPSEVVYVGRAPYLDPTTLTWFEWDNANNRYVNTDYSPSGILSVNGKTNANIVLTGDDIPVSSQDNTPINEAIPKITTQNKRLVISY